MGDADNSVIIATGKCLPELVVPNSAFLDHVFYTKNGKPEVKPIARILEKFHERTGIESRLYARDDQVASDLGTIALKNALDSSGINLDSIDLIIGASNYGDIQSPEFYCDFVPNMSSRLLSKLGYDNREGKIKAFDVLYGCPGWVEALIQADMHIKLGMATRVAVVAMETLSRVSDPHDKDSLIYSDGAGAVIVDAVPGTQKEGIIAYDSETITHFKARGTYGRVTDTSKFLTMEPSKNPDYEHPNRRFLNMFGPNVAQLATEHVPRIAGNVLTYTGWTPDEVKMFLLHQANRQLDYAMACAAGVCEEDLAKRVPITINNFGNSSVATIPTLIDMIARGELTSDCGCAYSFEPGDRLMIASVGASMNVNALSYLVPAQGLPYTR